MNRTKPWLTTGSIKHIENFLSSKVDLKILEFGCGSSTVWFSKKNDCKLFSIEHDKKWYSKISQEIKENNNTTLILKDRPYYTICDDFLDNFFDLILIDGRDRVECFKACEPKLKHGGLMILDNSEREEYSFIINSYKNKKTFIYDQKECDEFGFTYPRWTTQIWIK